MVFRFEDGKDVRYDLSNGQTIGKLGKPVKDICTQLRGYDILGVINSFQDDNYRNFLKFVDSRVNRSTACRRSSYYYRGRVDKVRNVGSFLSRIQNYSDYEQFFACGLEKVNYDVKCKITDVPKGLLKICRECDIELTKDLIFAYQKNPNNFNNIMNMNFYSISRKQVLNVMINAEISTWQSDTKIKRLLEGYNYKLQSLFTYFDNLITYEAIDGLNWIISEFYDYVTMVSRISPKYEKYPKNFLTTHKIACRNYNRLKEQFVEEDFKKRIDKSLEYSYGKYKFIYPESTQDIKDEAVQQNNCVASYIKSVINGDCHILFMRKKDDLEHSLVTIEVRNNQIVQAKGKFNRDVTKEEQLVVDKWNKKFANKEDKAA